MIEKNIGKEGTGDSPIKIGYKLTCDGDYKVVTSLSDTATWIHIITEGSDKEGKFIISVDPNSGYKRSIRVYAGINTGGCDNKYFVVTQDGEGESGECLFTLIPNTKIFEDCEAGTFAFHYVKEGSSPTPTECDGRITIHGNSTVTCDVMTTTLTAETTETCDVSGDYKENNPYSAVGSSGHLVKIGTINSGCEGSTDSWSFTHFDGEDVVDISSIRVLNVNEVHGIIKQNPTDVKRHENVRATCSSGCMDEFAIWQNGGSSDCDGKITIQGSPTVSCDDMTTTLTATTNNQ